MSRKTRLSVGPLPEQQADLGRYEETEVLWGRVAMVVLVLCAVLAGIISLLSGGKAEDGNGTAPAEIFSAAPMVKSATEVREVLSYQEPQAQDQTLSAKPEPALAGGAEEKTTSEANPLAQAETEMKNAAANSEGAQVPAKPALAEVISPVSIFHMGIARAELAHVLSDGKPATPLGYNITMSEQGIIKVILYTEMQDLDKRVLYHDWYLEDKRQARVRIPVNVAQQNSYSSKFINTGMLGDWAVKVVDEQGELYAQANFTVQ